MGDISCCLELQIIAEKFYALAKSKHLKSILQKYKTINECILYSIQRGGKGNAGKNCKKLQEDFYLNIFNPLEHYSLRTIYVDLPRLANVGSDEWISAEIFRYCGVSADNPNILIENVTSSLENVEAAKWSIYGSISPELCEQIGETDAYPAGNYQKKMIPVKAVVPALDEELGSRLVSHNKRKIEKGR